MKRIITLLFITFASLVLGQVSLHADESPIKISLGIREAKLPAITNVAFPLAFRIENTGKTTIKEDQIPALFFAGILHVLPKEGKEEQTKFQRIWRTAARDLQPGATVESPVVGNFLSFFPSLKDGVYQVWWTHGDLKSNVLNFTVTKGKVFRNDPAA